MVFAKQLPGRGTILMAIEPSGELRLLAVSIAKPVRNLTMGLDGTLYWTDSTLGKICHLPPKKSTTSLMESAPEIHPVRNPQGFTPSESPRALCLDPATGDLIVAHRHTILRITRAGAATTLLGSDQPGFASSEPGQPMPPGVACLDTPWGLAVHGEHLLIVDRRNVALRLFNLQTRELRTLVGTDPAGEDRLQEPRMGPLQAFAPDLPEETCAALKFIRGVSINHHGTCLVTLANQVVQLDLQNVVQPTAVSAEAPELAPGCCSVM